MVLARKLRPLLYLTILLCALSIIVSSVSLSGGSWYTRTAQNAAITNSSLEIEHGLFTGVKGRRFDAGADEKKDLAVVCEGDLCMFSCGLGEKRQQDIQNLIDTRENGDSKYCLDVGTKTITRTQSRLTFRNVEDAEFESRFLHIGYWLGTIVTVAAGILFSLVGMGFALYNTQESPTQPIVGVFGLYVWNGCAAASVLLGMIVWGSCFALGLREYGAVSDTISTDEAFVGSGNLGYSYWILLLSILFNLSNLGILYFHNWKLSQSERQITQVIDDKLTNGDILLF